MVQVPGSMNGAVPMSLTDMHLEDDSDDAESFIVLNRLTADNEEGIEGELAASVSDGAVREEGNSLGASRGAPSYTLETSTSSPGAVLNGELASSMYIAPNVLSLDVGQRMDSLIQDNQSLQVTVDQTNVALRQMMMTLSQWQLDTEKVRQEHKEKFQETRALVLKLKKEKAEMRATIESLQGKIAELENRPSVSSLLDKMTPSKDHLELVSLNERLVSQLEESKEAHQVEMKNSKAYLGGLAILRDEKQKLVEQINHYQAIEEKYKTNSEELQCLQNENIELKQKLHNVSSVERHLCDYQEAQTKGFTERIDELTVRYMNTVEELDKTQCELAQLKNLQQAPGSDGDALASAEATVTRLRSRIDEMTATLVTLEEKCDNQAQEILSLQRENHRLYRQHDETVGILQAQVEVYRSDFTKERESRERLAGEKEELAEDLRRLHRHNLQLREQQNKHRNAAIENSNTNPRDEENQSLPQEGDSASSSFRCPICQTMTFRTLQAVNEHIDRCLTPLD